MAADLYILPGLKHLVEKLLFRALSEENVVSLWQLAYSCNAAFLQRCAESFMRKRSGSLNFSGLSPDLELLLKDKLKNSE